MRKAVRSVLVVCVLLAAFAPAVASGDNSSGDNITCRLDGEATSGQAVATATCLQADPDTHGEFELLLTLTLQVLRDSEWVDVDTVECTGESVRGLGQTTCATAPPDVPGEAYRGLIDLEEPKDWAPATAQPHYQGGEPVQDPLASDACDVNELVDYDLTAPDAPWADLCAVTMDHVLDDNDRLASVTVTIHVAGLVDLRTETTSWQANLNTDECRHEVAVHDDGVIGQPGVRVDTKCQEAEPEPCGIIGETLAELTGGSCAGSRVWEESETSSLDDTAVEFLADRVRVTFAPGDLGPLGAADLVAGQTIVSVDAVTSTGLGSREDGSRIVVDGDFASSTGRTYTLD